MPNKTNEIERTLSVNDLRYAEYYAMQEEFDKLYARSQKGETFEDLMDFILMRENILLAYRNIKFNTGSKTAGTDGLKLDSIGDLPPDEVVNKVRFITCGSVHGYRPKPVRRKDIPKPNGELRPLGIPCIWDRLVQQCIKQVMEPICEAKFYRNSFGFRPERSVEHAMNRAYHLMQMAKLPYVIEFDIKGFFDNVDHSKLIKQIWAMGIQDKKLIYIIRQILKAPIKMKDGTMVIPTKGTPQGGIISPLLANIVLNELDWWISSQWEENPVVYKYKPQYRKGQLNKAHGYRAMRGTNLKTMFTVRYADDFRVFCDDRETAEKAKIAITQWLAQRLKLEVSEEKTKIVSLYDHYSNFLGFKMKLRQKGNKYTVVSRMGDKQFERIKAELLEQAKNIAQPRSGRDTFDEINLYNSKVMGIQNYFKYATDISKDVAKLQRAVDTVLVNRLQKEGNTELVKTGRKLTKVEEKTYGKSRMLRFHKGTGEPIYPIGYTRTQAPMNLKLGVCRYTPEGRALIHENLKIDTNLMIAMMKTASYDRSVQFTDNRVSLFSAQYGKCAVTGRKFQTLEEIHCHHKKPKSMGGDDSYANLILVLADVHKLIHANEQDTVRHYLEIVQLDVQQLNKLNDLREKAGNKPIEDILIS